MKILLLVTLQAKTTLDPHFRYNEIGKFKKKKKTNNKKNKVSLPTIMDKKYDTNSSFRVK